MSSPIHYSKNVDAALMYAPPWAREEGRTVPLVPEEGAAEALPEGAETDDARGEPDPAFSGDRAVLELQRRLALNPEMVPEPQPTRDDRAGAMVALRFGAVTLVAAFVAWLVVALPSLRQIRNDHVRTAALPAGGNSKAGKQNPSPAASISQPPRQETRPPAHEAPPPTAAAKPEVRPAASGAVAALPPASALSATPAIPASAPEKITLRLDDEETAALIKRGQDFLKNGDIASARLLLRRAAEAGSATAAFALAETYDAAGIQRLGAIGIQPEPAKAREWYQRAAQLGSEAASQQLATLAQPPQ
jgi:hypothetical protein